MRITLRAPGRRSYPDKRIVRVLRGRVAVCDRGRGRSSRTVTPPIRPIWTLSYGGAW